jgi:hypothetical protein
MLTNRKTLQTLREHQHRRKQQPWSNVEWFSRFLVLLLVATVLIVSQTSFYSGNAATITALGTSAAIEANDKKNTRVRVGHAETKAPTILVLTIHTPTKEGADKPKNVPGTQAEVGELRIRLRPDLSAESVAYIRALVTSSCERCNFYRADKPGILQGVMAAAETLPEVPRAPCPVGYETIENNCPDYDKDCGCHGPLMTRGMVGWAGGKTTPDFFINAYQEPVKLWGTQHTVWGEIQEGASFTVVHSIFET